MTDDEISRLRAALAKREPGPFHFRDICAGFDEMWIGDKVKAGHAFLDAVRAGRLPGVSDTGTKKGGGRLYLWSPDRAH